MGLRSTMPQTAVVRRPMLTTAPAVDNFAHTATILSCIVLAPAHQLRVTG
jgi:hypothetical protein